MLVHDHPPRGGGALALALLTGCAGDATVTDPAIALPTLSRDSLRPSFTIAPPLEITPANEQRCESRTVERDPGGRFVRWRASQREQVAVARAAADTVLTRYEAYAFDRTGAQTAEAQCILRRGTNAKQFMRGFFERPGRGGLVGVLAEATAAPVPPGVPPVFIGVGTVCLFDVWSWQMQCGNTTCYPMFAARAPTGAVRFGLAEDTATRVGGPTARLIGGWECPGVGHLSLNGNGTLTLHPNGGGGGGSGGGGGCGGGGGGSGGDSSGDGSVNPPGGGGGATSWWGASCGDTLPFDSLAIAEMTETIASCSAIPIELDGWNEQTTPPSENISGDPMVCLSTTCVAQNPGVWVGSWAIPTTNQFFRHTAIATSSPGAAPSITELVGWSESSTNIIHGPASTPHYFGEYRWTRVGDATRVGDVREATFHASFVYSGRVYALSSNRFVSAALVRSGITLTPAMRERIGRAPGICTCGSC